MPRAVHTAGSSMEWEQQVDSRAVLGQGSGPVERCVEGPGEARSRSAGVPPVSGAVRPSFAEARDGRRSGAPKVREVELPGMGSQAGETVQGLGLRFEVDVSGRKGNPQRALLSATYTAGRLMGSEDPVTDDRPLWGDGGPPE